MRSVVMRRRVVVFRAALHGYLGKEKDLVEQLSAITCGKNATKVYRIYGLYPRETTIEAESMPEINVPSSLHLL